MRRRKGGVRNPGGELRGFIGATDARRVTVCLDLRACHDTPPHHVVGYAPAISILSHQNRVGRFAFPSGSDSFPTEGIRVKKFLLQSV